jgi:hypothetical protein
VMSPLQELVCQVYSGCYNSCTSVVGCCDETDQKVLNVRIGKVRAMSCHSTGDDEEEDGGEERIVSDDDLKAIFLHTDKTYLM